MGSNTTPLANATALASLSEMSVALCPSSPVPARVGTPQQPHSSYAFNVGDIVQATANYTSAPVDFASIVNTPAMTAPSRRNRGPFAYWSVSSFRDFTDGTSNTVVMAERDLGSTNPKDIIGQAAVVAALGAPGPATAAGSCSANCSQGYFTTGTTVSGELSGARFFAGDFYYSGVTLIIPPNGCSCVTVQPTASQSGAIGYITPSSRHTGGCHVLLADGAVRFVSENIDSGTQANTAPLTGTQLRQSSYGIWGAIGTIDGGETANDF